MSADNIPFGKPGFDLHADQRGRIIASGSVSIFLATVAVILRLLSRKLSRAGLWWDDYLTIIAYAVSIVPSILSFVEIQDGSGRHIYIWGSLGPMKMMHFLKAQYSFEIFFHTSTGLAKIAILAFYYRIFSPPKFRRLVVWVAYLCLLYIISVDLAIIFQCQPIHYYWDKALKDSTGKCVSTYRFLIGTGSANLVVNFIVFILPIPLLFRLRTTVRQQIIQLAIFTVSGFVVLVSLIWIVVLSHPASEDVTWSLINATVWSALEPTLGVVCCCIPSLRPLFIITLQAITNANPVLRNKLSAFFSSTWTSGKSKSSGFNNLEEQLYVAKPYGHDVSVHGGRSGGRDLNSEGLELPSDEIRVEREIDVTSHRIEYRDHLF